MNAELLVRLVDDDATLRNGLLFALQMLGLSAVGYESAEEFLQKDDPSVPGCVVMDIRLGGMSGLECQTRMKAAGFDQPVVFLSGHGDVEMAIQAVKQGAADFLTKSVAAEKLAEACRRLFAWNLEDRERRSRRDAARARIASLTPRERIVAVEATTGAANKTIAQALGISEQGVKLHRSNIYAKLDVHSAVEIRRLFEVAQVPLDPTAREETRGAVETRLLPPEEA